MSSILPYISISIKVAQDMFSHLQSQIIVDHGTDNSSHSKFCLPFVMIDPSLQPYVQTSSRQVCIL